MSSPSSAATMANTTPDYLNFNSEELFNLTEGLLLRQAAPRTHFNPDFLEFFPGLREFTAQMQPLFDNNAPQSPSFNPPASPSYSFNSPAYRSTGSQPNSPLWDGPTNSSVFESPPHRSVSSNCGPTIPPYGYASPTYLPDSPSYRSQPCKPLPLSPSPQHQSLPQSYPTHPSSPSPPPSGRSSPYAKNTPIFSSSYGRLGFGEAQNIPTPFASPDSGSDSQEFPEITNIDSFARYLLGVTPASEESGSIFYDKAHLSKRSEYVSTCGFSTVSQDTQGLFVSQSPPGAQVSSQLQESCKPRAAEASKDSRRSQNQPVCSQCGTRETSLWRRDASGKPLCNACKLYFKVHGTARPQSWRRDVTQRRRRGRKGLKEGAQ